MKYKVGDKPIVRNLDSLVEEDAKKWVKNKDRDEIFVYDGDSPIVAVTKEMQIFCGKKVTIDLLTDNGYYIKDDDHWHVWCDEIFEENTKEEQGVTFTSPGHIIIGIDMMRFEAAKSAMQGMLANSEYISASVSSIISDSIMYADALIEELKKPKTIV
jgi:hypothetical protein